MESKAKEKINHLADKINEHNYEYYVLDVMYYMNTVQILFYVIYILDYIYNIYMLYIYNI